MLVTPVQMDPRVKDKVRLVRSTGCWEWTGSTTNGYGHFARRRGNPGGRLVKTYVHRYAYETFTGPIPPGYNVMHSTPHCRRVCLNPQHLKAVARARGFATLPPRHR